MLRLRWELVYFLVLVLLFDVLLRGGFFDSYFIARVARL